MILYYPLIVAPSLSPNVVPALAKTLERFLLIYRINDIMERISTGVDFDVTRVSTQSGIITVDTPTPIGMKENQEFRHGVLLEQPKYQRGTKGGATGSGPSTFDPHQRTTKFDLSMKGSSDLKSISLEPTYTLVELAGPTGKATKMLGIKVLPMRAVGSEEDLMKMLQYDRYASWLTTKALKKGREAVKTLVRIWSRMPFTTKIKDIEPTGKARGDILLSKTTFASDKRSNMFIALNKIDLPENVLAPAGVRKLQKLGWENFILVDDVSKVAYYCMKVLRGMCSEIPFPMMYQTVQQREPYETLEDIRKTSSSIFKRRVTFPKAIGENTMRPTDIYLEYLQEADIQIVTENIAAFLNKIKPQKFKEFIKNIRPAIREKDIGKISHHLNKLNLPPASEATIDKMILKAGPEFRKVYKVSSRVLSNTFQDASPTILKMASLMVAVKITKGKPADIMKATKDALKAFVKGVRKAMPKIKAPKEYMLDLAIGWALVILTITSIGILLGIGAALALPAIQAIGKGSWDLLFGGADIGTAAGGAAETFTAAWNAPDATVIVITVAVLYIVSQFIYDKVKGQDKPE